MSVPAGTANLMPSLFEPSDRGPKVEITLPPATGQRNLTPVGASLAASFAGAVVASLASGDDLLTPGDSLGSSASSPPFLAAPFGTGTGAGGSSEATGPVRGFTCTTRGGALGASMRAGMISSV